MTCTCDLTVIAPLAAQVQDVLSKIQAITKLTADMNRLNGDIAASVVDNLSILVPSIPLPPVLNISTLLGLATCPLTPLALGLSSDALAALDLRSLAIRYKRVLTAQSAQVQAQYDQLLQGLQSATVVIQMRKFVTECYRAMGDVADFIAAYPAALQTCLLIKGICNEIYVNPSYPFLALVDVSSTWSFDGFLPSEVDPRALPVLKILAQAEIKLNSWRTIALIPV
jgi:hypothetical protein